MDGIIFVSRVRASELEDDFTATRVFRNKSRYIIDIAVENYPTALRRVVLCDCRSC